MEKADAPAVIYQDQQISFAELNDLSCRLASAMAAMGITPGDRVGFWLPNTVAYIALYLACCRLGAIALAVNTRYRGVEVADIVKRSGTKALIMWPDFRNIDFRGILAEIDAEALAELGFHFVKVEAGNLLPESDQNEAHSTDRIQALKRRLDGAGIDLIVEKIETEQMLVELLDYNIDFGQGYLFGEPRLSQDPSSTPLTAGERP